MIEILKTLEQKKDVISIYNESNTENCWTGFIYAIDDEFILLSHITENGFCGGYTLFQIDTIRNIEQGTSYEKKTHKLYELRNQQHSCIYLEPRKTLLDSVLEYAFKEHVFISITLDENDEYPRTGIVKNISDEDVCIQLYNTIGKKNGLSYIKKYDIYQVFLDGLVEQNISMLSKIEMI